MKRLYNDINTGDLSFTANNLNQARIENVQTTQGSIAKNLLNCKDGDIINSCFIERIVGLGCDQAYQTLLTLRRINSFYYGVIEGFLNETLEKIYKPCDNSCETFEIFDRKNLFNGMISVSNFGIRSIFEQTLIFYFHAQRQLLNGLQNVMCETFVNLFNSRLDFFKSLILKNDWELRITWRSELGFNVYEKCEESCVTILADDSRIGKSFIENNVHLDISSSRSAYLFGYFLKLYVSSDMFENWELRQRILLFIDKYRGSSVTQTLIKDLINIINRLIEAVIHPTCKQKSWEAKQDLPHALNFLSELTERGWFNKDIANTDQLFQNTLECGFNNDSELQIEIFKFLYALIEKNLVDRSLIDQFKLQEIVENELLSSDNENYASLLLLLLIEKGYAESLYIEKYNLIEGSMNLNGDLVYSCKKLGSFKAIAGQVRETIYPYLQNAISTLEIEDFINKKGILYQC
ncbi:MAG: hypothetical protein C5B43_03380, partial [Verrucomicrobia bacterium]